MGQCFSSDGSDAAAPAKGSGAKGGMFGYPTNYEDLYDTGKELGRGTFGTTYLCTKKGMSAEEKNKHTYAVKVILKSSLQGEGDIEDVKREVKIMQLLNGKSHVVTLEDAFEDKTSVKMILELCAGGELFERIVKAKRFSEKTCAVVIQQMLRAVNYMHTHGFAHRDLKPENFLLLEDSAIEETPLKLVDFGLSRAFEPEAARNFRSRVGTALYMAPEVQTGKYDERCDIWSIGIIMYILLCGRAPFRGDEEAILAKAKRGVVPYEKEMWAACSSRAQIFVKQLLAGEPWARPTAERALADLWFRELLAADESTLSALAVDNLRSFASMGKLKQTALSVIAGQLRDVEICQLRDTFLAMDADQNGSLSALEIKAGFREAGLAAPPELDALLRGIDTDGNGSVDYREFLAATMDRQKYVQEDVCWAAFKAFDRDDSGTITRDELAEVFASGDVCDALHLTPAALDALLAEADSDGSGDISFDEFLVMIRSGNALAPGAQARNESDTTASSKASDAGSEQGERPSAAAGGSVVRRISAPRPARLSAVRARRRSETDPATVGATRTSKDIPDSATRGGRRPPPKRKTSAEF